MAPAFSSELLLDLIRIAMASEEEVCGILRSVGHRVVRADPARNRAADPARAFEIDPSTLLAAHRDARVPGAASIAGYYHSHPGGRPDPSRTDAATAAPDGALWLIIGGRVARLWRAVPDGGVVGRFDSVAFDVTIGNRVEKNCLAVQMVGHARDASIRVVQEVPR